MSACQKRKKATTDAVAFLERLREWGVSERRNSHGAARRCRHGKRCRINTVPGTLGGVQLTKTLPARTEERESIREILDPVDDLIDSILLLADEAMPVLSSTHVAGGARTNASRA